MSRSTPTSSSGAVPEPCALVLFGATGDLTRRKLIPALFSLHCQKLLPHSFALVAYGRKPLDSAAFSAGLRADGARLAPHLNWEGVDWASFASRVSYQQGQLDDSAGFAALRQTLEKLDDTAKLRGNRLFYVATPPDRFAGIAKQLGAAGLGAHGEHPGWARIVVEKPFGNDLKTAQKLNTDLRGAFPEEAIYRIDHYLGKETVQNILVMRFANRLFELLWNHLYIDNVQITVAETLGVEGRGPYFDEAGIVRDIVQNHALQLLTLIAMEPPVSLDADAIRDEKVKVLKSMRPIGTRGAFTEAVRAQYGAGGGHIQAYSNEDGVGSGTQTETFGAFRFWVDNWRWAGVPFYVRAGKRLHQRVTKVVLQLRDAPDVLFARLACSKSLPNRITIRIQPDEGIEILMGAKEPGPSIQVDPVRMKFSYSEAFDKVIPDAYERLLLNAMLGDASLFARDDEVEEAWKLVDPVLEAWARSSDKLNQYTPGSWGPEAADELPSRDGRAWWNE